MFKTSLYVEYVLLMFAGVVMAGSAPEGFTVHYPALRRYAEIIAAQARRLQQINAALSGAGVPAGAFGKLPESGTLHGEYEAHARAEITNTADLPGLLEGVAEALETTADHYAQPNQRSRKRFMPPAQGAADRARPQRHR